MPRVRADAPVAMIKASDEGGLRLLWVYISAAGWEQTPLRRFQATHDTKKPLESRPVPEQNDILLSVAQQMKEAALGATRRFKDQPNHTPVSSGVSTKTGAPL